MCIIHLAFLVLYINSLNLSAVLSCQEMHPAQLRQALRLTVEIAKKNGMDLFANSKQQFLMFLAKQVGLGLCEVTGN